MLLSVLLGLILNGGYAAGLVAVEWRVAAKRGARWLPLTWLVGALAFWLLSLVKFRLQGTPINYPPQTLLDRVAMFGSLAYGLVGAGFTTLSVRKRFRRSTDGRLTPAAVGAGVGAFFVGMLVVVLVVAIDDVAALIGRMAL